MYTIFLTGGTASGKTEVGRYLEQKGACRVDLDGLSRQVLEPGSACLQDIQEAFGEDLVDPDTGELNRALLAKRAFSSDEATRHLEALELPYIKQELLYLLDDDSSTVVHPKVCVVEIPLLDRVEDLFDLADEICWVYTPDDIRLKRAELRGMSRDDFLARVSRQPSKGYLETHATHMIDNSSDTAHLLEQLDSWWDAIMARVDAPAV